jgi:alpha-tubulin suppressor-like RCC1 family protein
MKTKLLLLAFLFCIKINAQCWQSISANYSTLNGNFSLAIKQDGTLWSWGRNDFGQLGLGNYDDKNIPTQIGTASDWAYVSAGGRQSYAIKQDGTLWSWGDNFYGQLGTGNLTYYNVPTQIGTDINWAAVYGGGFSFAIGLKTNGTLWAWGNNEEGQLGIGTIVNTNVPIQIGTDTNWQTASAGEKYVCAIKSSGTLWSWGENNYGQLGLGVTSTASVNLPTQIGSDTNWSKVSCGFDHTLASKTIGTLWSWGNNFAGQLGDNSTAHKNAPVQISEGNSPDSIVPEFSAGLRFSLGITASGKLYAWGSGQYGQLGDNATTGHIIPTQIGTDTDWLMVKTGLGHTLTLKGTSNTIYSMGLNNFGQLGDGTIIDKLIPTVVTCPTTLSYNEFSANTVNISPNPVHNFLNISLDDSETIQEIWIYDLLGKEIFSQSNSQSIVNTEEFESGIYILRIITNQNKIQTKFIKN